MARLVRSAAAAGLASLLTRASALLREVAFAAVFGASAQADAYLAALRIPNLLRDLLAEGSMSNAFVPRFARALERDAAEARALVDVVAGWLGLVLVAVTLLIVALATPSVYLVAAGFAATPGKVALTASLVQWLAPTLACASATSLLGGLLNVRGRFFAPALAPALVNLAVIAACFLPGFGAGGPGITVVAAATTLGAVLGVAVLLPGARAAGFQVRPRLGDHPELRPMLGVLAPVLISVVAIQVGVLVDGQIAALSGEGAVAHLSYAFRVAQLPRTLLAGPIAMANLALLSVAVARRDLVEARALQADAISATNLFGVPAAIGLAIFAEPLVAVLFERGQFGAIDTVETASLLRLYAPVALALCVHRTAIPAFFAWGDAWGPVLITAGAIVLRAPLAWALAAGPLGVAGVPWSHALASTLETLGLLALLARRSGGLGPGFWREHGRILVAGVVMAAVGLAGRGLAVGTTGQLVAAAVSGAVYLGIAWRRRG